MLGVKPNTALTFEYVIFRATRIASGYIAPIERESKKTCVRFGSNPRARMS